MSNTVTCPNCRTEIQITEAIELQLSAQIRQQLEGELNVKRQELETATKHLKQQKQALAESQDAIEERIRTGIASQRQQLLADAKKLALEELALEIDDREERVRELQAKLKESRTAELELRKRERELKTRTEELQLEVSRQIEAERDKIRVETRRHTEEQHQFKDAEKEKQISDLRKQIDELKRKAEQGSQQIQGEVQELALEEYLSRSFPRDLVEPIAKGVRGGDVLQGVLDSSGLNCGRILWESKRTKNWSNGWLAKARDDQRSARAGCVVIVSEALPDDVQTLALIDGVWVCSWSCAGGLAAALRAGLIEVAKSKLALQGQHEKMELVYNYLAGQEFQQRVAGVVEAFIAMQADLDSEKRSMQRIWSKREKQLQRVLTNTATLYGDLQGIIGASLPAIDGLSLTQLESAEVVGRERLAAP